MRLDEDDDSEDSLLMLLRDSAKDYYLNSIGLEFPEDKSLSKLYLMILITHWYENREMIGKVKAEISPTIKNIALQLKCSV